MPSPRLTALLLTFAPLLCCGALYAQQPPPHAVLRNALTLTAQDHHLDAQHDLTFEVFDPSAPLHLIPADLPVSQVLLDGRPAPTLILDQHLCAVVSSAGTHQLTIHYRVTDTPAPNHITRLPRLAHPLLLLSIPAAPGLTPHLPDNTPQELTPQGLRAWLPPGDQLAVHWLPLPGTLPLLLPPVEQLRASWEIGGERDPKRAALTLRGRAEAFPLYQLAVRLPGQAPRTDDPRVSSLTPGPDHTTLLTFDPPLQGDFALTLTLPDHDGDTLTLPTLTLPGLPDPEVTLLLRTLHLLPSLPDGAPLLPLPTPDGTAAAFALPSHTAVLLQRHPALALPPHAATSLRAHTLLTPNDDALTHLLLQIETARPEPLRITLPPGAVLTTLRLNGRDLLPATQPDGDLLLALPTTPPAQPATLELLLLQHTPSPHGLYGSLDLRLPTFHLPLQDALWTLAAPDHLAFFDPQGAFALAPDPRQAQAAASILQLASPLTHPDTPQRLLDLLQRTPESHALTFQRNAAPEAAPLHLQLRFYHRRLTQSAQVFAFFSFFIVALAAAALLLLSIRRGRPTFHMRWTLTAAIAAAAALLTWLLLPIPLPPIWALLLLTLAATSLYGTLVFWTTFIALARDLWERFTAPEDPEDDQDEPSLPR